jgi:hypothetical protein
MHPFDSGLRHKLRGLHPGADRRWVSKWVSLPFSRRGPHNLDRLLNGKNSVLDFVFALHGLAYRGVFQYLEILLQNLNFSSLRLTLKLIFLLLALEVNFNLFPHVCLLNIRVLSLLLVQDHYLVSLLL